MVEQFNAATADVIVEAGGRVIKTIGDEVMFTTTDAAAGVVAGLGLLDDISPATGFPSLRVAVATGEVLAREGDVFGPTVNLASRLVTVARRDTLLIDADTQSALSTTSGSG
jgi:adenylate cyclase